MNHKEYYTALGKLVYVIANANGSIHNEEVSSIFHFVIAHLVDVEKETIDGNGANEVFDIEKEFHRLRDEEILMKEAYKDFIKFLDDNSENINDKMKKTILTAMEKVAMAYNGIEESEKIIINEIKEKISKI